MSRCTQLLLSLLLSLFAVVATATASHAQGEWTQKETRLSPAFVLLSAHASVARVPTDYGEKIGLYFHFLGHLTTWYEEVCQ